ncbi:DUF6178 family protein [Geobacter sp.]|uniref:DUF6178 family protein n=1 Tax=Geobacter sp. TaxID=46610 RepID=UPI0027B96BFD|nr:DUF6178 family protein [Geobacter sp.]
MGNEPERSTVVSLDSERRKRAATAEGFASLPLAAKITTLRELPAKQRMDLILNDPAAKELARALPEQELYWLIKEIGETDALELWELASPEQRTFMLDMELWDKWNFTAEKSYEWLGHLLEAGETALVEQLPHLDLELLLLMLEKEISVGGGIGELLPDEERVADWDHSFDNLYFITFKNNKHARTVGSFIDIIFRNDRRLYMGLMEGIKGELEDELEDLAFRFRSGRLADLGFPELEEAQSLYARFDPASFALEGGKKLFAAATPRHLPARAGAADSLLNRLLSRPDTEEINQELTYLVNSALVADGAALHDQEAMQRIFERVHGYLTIALEFLTGDDEEKAAAILASERLKRLFQLGFSIVMGLVKQAQGLTSDDYATGKALRALHTTPPRYYRAFDPDGVDGFREFHDMADVERVREFLARV